MSLTERIILVVGVVLLNMIFFAVGYQIGREDEQNASKTLPAPKPENEQS